MSAKLIPFSQRTDPADHYTRVLNQIRAELTEEDKVGRQRAMREYLAKCNAIMRKYSPELFE